MISLYHNPEKVVVFWIKAYIKTDNTQSEG